MNNYGKIEENAPPNIAEGAQYPPAQYQPAAAPPGANMYPAAPPVGQYAGYQGIIYVQSPVIPEQEAPDHLAMAILVTICCCLPFGIVAILKANECRNARNRGDRENALQYGREAKKFSLVGLGCGIGIIVVILAIYGIVLGLALTHAGLQ